MKFIPGTKFINNTMSNTKLFKRGVLYKLHNIKKIDNGFTYIFSVNGELKDINFASTEQADEWLETIKV